MTCILYKQEGKDNKTEIFKHHANFPNDIYRKYRSQMKTTILYKCEARVLIHLLASSVFSAQDLCMMTLKSFQLERFTSKYQYIWDREQGL